jgi:hypothetical protein
MTKPIVAFRNFTEVPNQSMKTQLRFGEEKELFFTWDGYAI